MRIGQKSIRSKIILTLVVPVVALSVLWGLAVSAQVSDATALRSAYSLRDEVGRPCDLMVEALQAERSRSQEFLAVLPRDGTELRARRTETDTAVGEFQRLSSNYHGTGLDADVTRARIAEMTTSLGTLASLRAQIDAGEINRAAALSGYSQVIADAFSVLSAASAFSEVTVSRIMGVVVGIRHAGELLSQEDALLTGAVMAGRFDGDEHVQLVEIVGALRFQIPNAGSALPQEVKTAYYAMLNSPTFSSLRNIEDRIVRQGRSAGPMPITRDQWKATFDPAAQAMYGFLAGGYDLAVSVARDAGNDILIRFGVASVLGLIAIILSLFVSIRIGSSIVHRLSVLRASADDLATRRLPRVISRLRSGEQVDVLDYPPDLPVGKDEIGQIGIALSAVQRRAIESAVGEADVRYGMRKMFVNIARRNQTLINRQLEALTRIRSVAGQESLIAHAEQLAIRMRRNAEHLVILAGSARSGRKHQPEPLAEVINRAVGEVEDAGRIELRKIANAQVPGRAADDVVHLLAELLDNATSFSPPHTSVTVSAHRMSDGVSVEIEDRGLGMKPSALAETNRRMALPPDFDPADSARLGHFVVAQLASERGIRVDLRSSESGGVTAVVTLPPDIAEVVSASASMVEPMERAAP